MTLAEFIKSNMKCSLRREDLEEIKSERDDGSSQSDADSLGADSEAQDCDLQEQDQILNRILRDLDPRAYDEARRRSAEQKPTPIPEADANKLLAGLKKKRTATPCESRHMRYRL